MRKANTGPLTESEIEFLTSRGYEISRSMHGPLMEIRQRVRMSCHRCGVTGKFTVHTPCFACDGRGYDYVEPRSAIRRIQKLEVSAESFNRVVTNAFLTAEAECYANEANGFGYVTNADLVTEAVIAGLAQIMPEEEARARVISKVWEDVIEGLMGASTYQGDFAERFADLIVDGFDPRTFTEKQKNSVIDIYARARGRRGSKSYRSRYDALAARLFLWDDYEKVLLGRLTQVLRQGTKRP